MPYVQLRIATAVHHRLKCARMLHCPGAKFGCVEVIDASS